ncbi:MAG: UvrD-helicase domain-containing protein, partial [Pseudomonadota bacterium]
MDELMIPAEADAAQRRSSDPESSVWVSANAGAGKTYVLSQRVVRLLLSGVDPQGILCLTYTNAAAAEMAGRVFKELEGLTSMSDAALTERLKVLAPQLDPAAAVARARTLFARTLETPAGLKISTVHAFAAALLRQFPVEADVSSAFALLDDPAREELTDRAVSAVLSEADAHPGGALAKALEAAVPFVADGNFSDALKTLMADRALARWVGEKPDAATLEQDLHRALAILPPPKLAPSVIATHWLIAVAQAMRAVGSKRLDADRLLAIAAAEGEDRDRMFRELLFKTAGGPQRLTYLVPKTEHEAAPDARDMLEAEQNRQLALLPVEQARDVTAATVPLVLLAAEALRRVDSEKRRRGLLDYDDQIDKAVALLRGQSAAAWVRYRLDEGIDHILLDEAQDTSPAQWELLRALTDEFYDGLGARDTPRTLFVVGDEKQSIYSFQGAAPRLFGTEQDSYRARAGNAGAPFRSVSLSHSFRSAPQILEAVDTVFSEPALSEALGGSAVRHAAIKNMSGGVDVWPLFADEAEEMPLAWDAPLDRTSAASGTSRLANAIADQIEEWMVRGPCGGAPITPGGVLILSRKRGPFTRAMNRVLKDRNIPAAGPDRLTVSEHIAVKDMVALARALLSRDDLSLAAVLRSPLFGFSDDALFAVAHGRDGPLLDALSRTEAGRAAKETL